MTRPTCKTPSPSKETAESSWKKRIARSLVETGVVGNAFTGKIVLNFNCGSISDMEKVERIK